MRCRRTAWPTSAWRCWLGGGRWGGGGWRGMGWEQIASSRCHDVMMSRCHDVLMSRCREQIASSGRESLARRGGPLPGLGGRVCGALRRLVLLAAAQGVRWAVCTCALRVMVASRPSRRPPLPCRRASIAHRTRACCRVRARAAFPTRPNTPSGWAPVTRVCVPLAHRHTHPTHPRAGVRSVAVRAPLAEGDTQHLDNAYLDQVGSRTRKDLSSCLSSWLDS